MNFKNSRNDIIICFFYGFLAGCSYLGQTPSIFKHFILVLAINLLLKFLYGMELTVKKSLQLISSFFYGYFLISLYWIHLSLISIDKTWIVPLAILSFPLILCCFTFWIGFVVYLTNQYQRHIFALCFALSFWIAELMMGHLCTGFPWILSAYTLNEYGMQGGAFIGVYGMSLLVLLWGTSFFYISRKIYIILFMILVHLLGYYRLMITPFDSTLTTIRIVHPQISQKDKNSPDEIRKNFEKYLALSSLKAERPLNLIVWPEAVIPVALNKYPPLVDEIKEISPKDGYVVVGAPRVADDHSIFTSSYTINNEGVIDTYDKIHTVPFGEYLPFRSILEKIGFSNLTMGSHDYSSGTERNIYCLKNIPPFCSLICYEIIFPNQILSTKNERPEWILNQTNDAWYLNSSGIYQHLNIVRWRAVEEGLPIVRCVNSGVSALIDGAGRIRASLRYDQVGVIDDFIPKALEPTFYSKLRSLLIYFNTRSQI